MHSKVLGFFKNLTLQAYCLIQYRFRLKQFTRPRPRVSCTVVLIISPTSSQVTPRFHTMSYMYLQWSPSTSDGASIHRSSITYHTQSNPYQTLSQNTCYLKCGGGGERKGETVCWCQCLQLHTMCDNHWTDRHNQHRKTTYTRVKTGSNQDLSCHVSPDVSWRHPDVR